MRVSMYSCRFMGVGQRSGWARENPLAARGYQGAQGRPQGSSGLRGGSLNQSSLRGTRVLLVVPAGD